MSVRSICYVVLFNVSWFSFCLDSLFIGMNGILKSPTVTVLKINP